MRRNRSLPVFLGLTVLSGIAVLSAFLQPKPCQRLRCIAFQNLESFRLQDVYQDDKNIYRALLTNGDELLRVEVTSERSASLARRHIQGEITRMKALFANAISPYPGEISDEIVCGRQFTPEFTISKNDGLDVFSFLGYLNSRLVFGACTEDQTVYRGILALFYCPENHQVFQLEVMAPKGEFAKSPQRYHQMIQTLRCRK